MMNTVSERSESLRVLMTTDTVGGVFGYVENLARELSVHGAQIIVASMGPLADAAQKSALMRIHGVELVESEWKLEWMDDPWSDVDRAGDWLLELERRTRPDIVHLNGYAHGALAFSAPKVIVAHSCVLSWWRAVYGAAAPEQYETYRERVRAGLFQADLVVTPSHWMESALLREYGARVPSMVLPNGILQPDNGVALAARQREPFFLAAGRFWDAAKNLKLLDRAAPNLPWPTYIAGGSIGEPSTSSRPGVCQLGILNHAQMQRWMERAAVFLHPARYEPFGLAPLEAASLGCALVLGNIESLREIWADAALYVEPDDDEALIQVACRLAQDDRWRQQHAERAQKRAARFSATRMGEAYLECYRSLLATSANRYRDTRSPREQPSDSVRWAADAPSVSGAREYS
jgi:glycosyltransferase involved in cell wall biosynthesis